MEVMLGNRPLTGVNDLDLRMAILLWGDAGCGKTTLASTAPGVKLWILFDPDGVTSLAGRDDILVLDLSGDSHRIVERMKDDNPFGIEKLLTEHPEIETVVFDSATAFATLATENAVATVKSATIENPGLKGYGHRNAVVLRAITALMRVTKRFNRHFICISHEDTPDKNEDGTVNFITLALGGKMVNQIGLSINEIWWMADTGKERRIAIRNVRGRKPMKSRMFDLTTGTGEFQWKYDASTWTGDGISTWFQQWKDAKGHKIPLPK